MPKGLKIFLSSPGDVSEERALAARVFDRLGREYSDSFQLDVVVWEHEPLFAHSGYQEQIDRPSQCDLVVSILWSRLGTRLPSNYATAPGEAAPTGTEYEVRDALDAYRRLGKPNLLIYKRTAAPQVNLAAEDAEERLRQYRQLEEFCHRAFYDSEGAVVVAHTAYECPYEFERKLTDHARKWLERQAGSVSPLPRWTLGSPYRGLEVFEAQHRDIYFGRSQAVSELMKKMRTAELRASTGETVTRFLLVQGMSGSGKSSLVRAGLLPLLEGRAIEGIGVWDHVIVRPSEQPVTAGTGGVMGVFAEHLFAALPELATVYKVQHLADLFTLAPSDATARLDGYLTEAARRRGLKATQIRLLVYVDQLEECWSALPRPERSAFGNLLVALSYEPRIWVLATLRSDFVGRLAETAEYVPLLRSGETYALVAPQADELLEMIREPSVVAGLLWESRDGVSLDRAIHREALESPESLPLLEYALDQLYERRVNRTLTYAAYEALGRLGGGIAASADAVMKDMGEIGSLALPTVLRALVRVDETASATRRNAAFDEFPGGTAERALIGRLIERRLCVSDEKSGRAVVSLAHEALLRNWPRLTDWLAAERNLLQERETVERETLVWESHGRASDWLATTADKLAMHRGLAHASVTLPKSARDFMLRSQARAHRNSRLKRAAIMGLIVSTVGASFLGIDAARQRDAAQNALSTYLASKAWANLSSEHLGPAISYALAAYDVARPRGKQTQTLFDAIAFNLSDNGGVVLSGHTSFLQCAWFSPDGTRVLTASFDKSARIWGAADGRELTRLRHDDALQSAAFSGDGKRVVTASSDKTARVWDGSSGQELIRFTHGGQVNMASFSPDGRLVVTASADKTAGVWDVATGREMARLTHDAEVRSAAFSADGTRVVTASDDHTARVWNSTSGQQLVRLAHDDDVRSAVFSPDGMRVLTASEDKTARLWDVTTGHQLARLAHDGWVRTAAFSPDGARVVTASEDKTARVWDVASGHEIARFLHTEIVRTAEFSADGTRVLTASDDRSARVWDATRGLLLARFEHGSAVYAAAFSRDGKRVVTASDDGTARVWILAAGLGVARLVHHDVVTSAAFSPDGKRVLTVSADGDAIRLWDSISGREMARLPLEDPPLGASFSPDSTKVLTVAESNSAGIWDIATGRQLSSLAIASGAVFSPDGSRVITASYNKCAQIWDATSGRAQLSLMHDNWVNSAAFSFDGKRVITASADKTARVWNAVSGKELLRLVHIAPVQYAAFFPDGGRVLTVAQDNTGHVWDAVSGRELIHFAHKGVINAASFSRDGARVVTASNDGTARIWGTDNGAEVVRFVHGYRVNSAKFSPDDRWVITASADKTARVWDAVTGRELIRITHDQWVNDAAFSSDGKRVVTASYDHSARVIDVSQLSLEIRELGIRLCKSPTRFPLEFSDTELLAEPTLAQIRPARTAGARVCAEL